MSTPVLEVLSPGLGATFQDRGRPGWRRFGVPPGGPMDPHAAQLANRLLNNSSHAPILELLLQGARLRVLSPIWFAIAGADTQATVPLWRASRLESGDLIEFPRNRSGVWTYLAVEGGFEAKHWLGSASAYPRALLGQICRPGDILSRCANGSFELPPGVAGRSIIPAERRAYQNPPPFRVWPGPQWADFDPLTRELFFRLPWSVTGQSDRVGYRLQGKELHARCSQIVSEPTRLGSIQIPGNGQPIVLMRDGPTVGGYPKLGMVHPTDLSWLAQCRPGQKVRFVPIHETRSEL